MTRRYRLLVFAYACEPGRGSEPGAGWGMVRALSQVSECVVLIGPTHAEPIAEWERVHGTSEGVTFVVVPEASHPTIPGRGRIGWFIAYLRWLRRAEATAHKLHAERAFDAVCHASYSTYWLPTPAVRLGIPCLWGPVGGAVVTPLQLWPALGLPGVGIEFLDLLVVRACAALPATRRTWADAGWRVLQNNATLSRLPARLRDRSTVLNHALFTEIEPRSSVLPGRHLLFVGGLQTRKGLRLVLSALAQTPPAVSLTIVGDGPERRAMERLAHRLGVVGRVEFRGHLDRAVVLGMFAEAAASVFTGLREEGGLALAEAMLCGCAVIVLDHGGPSAIMAYATDQSRVARIRPGTVAGTARRLAAAMTRFALHPPTEAGPLLDQVKARAELAEIVDRMIASGVAG